mmetsp:Transcript_40222/g.100673  ORF Transcript_40222/g.100673 Transcript_40222/m.100673 type:complete len:281 (-) Transcript_40222:1273-2115(-)
MTEALQHFSTLEAIGVVFDSSGPYHLNMTTINERDLGRQMHLRTIVWTRTALKKYPAEALKEISTEGHKRHEKHHGHGVSHTYFSGNMINDVPRAICDLEGLRSLDVRCNQLATLPSCLATRPKKLQHVFMTVNPICDVDQAGSSFFDSSDAWRAFNAKHDPCLRQLMAGHADDVIDPLFLASSQVDHRCLEPQCSKLWNSFQSLDVSRDGCAQIEELQSFFPGLSAGTLDRMIERLLPLLADPPDPQQQQTGAACATFIVFVLSVSRVSFDCGLCSFER